MKKTGNKFLDIIFYIENEMDLNPSIICVSILFLLVDSIERSDSLSMRDLYKKMHTFSGKGIKNNLSMIETKGLIKYVKSKEDQRVVLLVPTRKLVSYASSIQKFI